MYTIMLLRAAGHALNRASTASITSFAAFSSSLSSGISPLLSAWVGVVGVRLVRVIRLVSSVRLVKVERMGMRMRRAVGVRLTGMGMVWTAAHEVWCRREGGPCTGSDFNALVKTQVGGMLRQVRGSARAWVGVAVFKASAHARV